LLVPGQTLTIKVGQLANSYGTVIDAQAIGASTSGLTQVTPPPPPGYAVSPASGQPPAALNFYCRNDGYLNSLRKGGARFDLAGEPAGTVTGEEASRAAAEVRSHKVKRLMRTRLRQEAEATAERERQVAEAAAAKPKRISLSDLKAAAQARRQTEPVT
jgi:hypothetical protein